MAVARARYSMHTMHKQYTPTRLVKPYIQRPQTAKASLHRWHFRNKYTEKPCITKTYTSMTETMHTITPMVQCVQFSSMYQREHGSFCMNYCINVEWHGVDQPLVMLRGYGSPGCIDSGLQLACIAKFQHGSHRLLDNTPYIFYGVQIRRVCWPIKHSNPIVIKRYWYFWQCGQVPSPAEK